MSELVIAWAIHYNFLPTVSCVKLFTLQAVDGITTLLQTTPSVRWVLGHFLCYLRAICPQFQRTEGVSIGRTLLPSTNN
jgi:hypothetical protein